MGKEQAQAAITTTAEQVKTGSDDTVSQVDLSKASLEQLDELFKTGTLTVQPDPASGGKEGQETTGKAAEAAPPEVEAPVETTATAEEPGETPAAEATEVVEEATIPETPAATAEPEGEELPDRFRHKDPIDRAINAVFKSAQQIGAPITWAEAERRVKGEPTAPKAEATQAVTLEDLRTGVTTLETEVKDTETQLDDALIRMDKLAEDESLYGPEHGKVQKEIATLTKTLTKKGVELMNRKGELREAEATEKAEASKAQTEHQTGRDKAKGRAIELYPDAADETTALGKAVSKRIAELRDPNHPDHSTLYADSAPLTVTATVAAEMGIAPKSKTTSPTAKPAPASQPRTTASPASAAKTAVKPGKPAEDAKKTFEYLRNEAPLEELDRLFGASNNPLLVPH